MEGIEELMMLVADRWPFDEEHYPGIRGLSDEEKKCFALRHVLMHQAKAVGKLSEALEPTDHGLDVDMENIRIVVQKFLINTMRLALLCDVSGEDLFDSVKRWAERRK